MVNEITVVESVSEVKKNIFLLKTFSPAIASEIKPGQFCNIKVSETEFPLLRRPFSVCDVEGEFLYFLFDVHGVGTELLSKKNKGDKIEILGPLGNGFVYNKQFDKAVIAAGGLGVAPFPYLTKELESNSEIISFVGGRTENYVVDYGIKNLYPSTDDGSLGFKGTVVELMEEEKEKFVNEKTVIFACGPNPMLKAVKEFAGKYNIECQVSAECAMACGFGICQGCPIESTKDHEKYLLVCKDGPVFNAEDIEL